MEAIDGFEKAIEGYKHNLNKITTGRANPAVLNGVRVMYYDTLTPLVEMATVSTPEPRQLLIKPFDLGSVKDVTAAINSASLGLNAVNEGNQIRITLPDLTTERRKEMVKSLATYTEQARVQIRLVRQD
uniref:Ribosome-recycling factor, mitochondrial n=1 Tax=Biomphalaria glabrata TaxID=6526 RepID=A0A2C9KTL5_BIOGL